MRASGFTICARSLLIVMLVEMAQPNCVRAEEEVGKGGSAEGLFKRDYKTALQLIEKYYSEVTAIGVLRRTRAIRDRQPEQLAWRFKFQMSAGASKYEQFDISGTNPDTLDCSVWCRNPGHYLFHIARDSPDSLFHATDFGKSDAPISDSMERYAYRHFRAPYAVFGVPVDEIMADRSFALRSVRFVEENSLPLIHVTYRFAPTQRLDLQDGEIWLQYTRGWVIHRYRTFLDFAPDPSVKSTAECSIEYEAERDGIPVPKRVQIHQQFGKSRIDDVFEFEQFEHVRTPAEEFTLAHYGMNEAEVSKYFDIGSRSRLHQWSIVGNIVLILIIFGIVILRRRLRAT